MVNRSEKGSSPVFNLYENCLRHNLAETPLMRHIIANVLSEGQHYPVQYPVSDNDSIIQTDSNEAFFSINYHGILHCRTTKLDQYGNYIFDAKSLPAVGQSDPKYYRPSGLKFNSSTGSLLFMIPAMDDELIEYVPDNYSQRNTIFTFQSQGFESPQWYADEININDQILNRQVLNYSGRLNTIFIEAAAQGQLPGFKYHLGQNTPVFSGHDFNQNTLFPQTFAK